MSGLPEKEADDCVADDHGTLQNLDNNTILRVRYSYTSGRHNTETVYLGPGQKHQLHQQDTGLITQVALVAIAVAVDKN
jgi:hypothetical protein